VAFPPYKSVQTTDSVLSRIQDALEGVLAPILANTSLDSQRLSNVALKTGSNPVPHKLRRRCEEWTVVRKSGPADIYEDRTPDINFLYLHASADVIVSLRVS
jgi:hypothetical protein